jgi:prepilin-type processing-associated H-X9-DG protein/prepilin-type N-terminal cleavage/methylation domain-containing protein
VKRFRPYRQVTAARHKAAFTLLEILIVFVVLGILAVLAFPTMKGVLEKSHDAKCMGNLKQLAATHLLYAADNNGSFVTYYDPNYNIPARGHWPRIFADQGYIPLDNGVQICLSLKGSDVKLVNEDNIHYGYNYLHLGSSFRYGGSLEPAKLSQIAKLAETILLADSYRPNAGAHGEPRGSYLLSDAKGGPFIPHARHGGGVNIAWTDGHVSRIRIKNPSDPWAELGGDTAPSFFDRE